MTVIDWYLIRHAPVLGDKEKLYQSVDEPADLSQRNRLDQLAEYLPDQVEWHSSPLKRARNTAEYLARQKTDEPEIEIDNKLAEQDFGEWFGLSFDQLWPLIKPYPPHNWSILSADTCPPGGESFKAVWGRVADYLQEFSDVKKNKSRIIVSHAGVIRAMLGHMLEMSPDMALSFALDPLSLTHLQYSHHDYQGGHWRLVKMNAIIGE